MSTSSSVQETKFIYYIDEEETPYLVKLSISPDKVTLGDFKNALNRPHTKFFFKSIDDDFGVVKEEIFDDNAVLPCFNGRIISWLVSADDSTVSDSGPLNPIDTTSNCNPAVSGNNHNGNHVRTNNNSTSNNNNNNSHNGTCHLNILGDLESKYQINDSVPQTHATAALADSTSTSIGNGGNCDTETESVHSANQDRIAPLRNFHYYKAGGRHHIATGNSPTTNHHGQQLVHPNSRHRHYRHNLGTGTYETPSIMSSDLESTSVFDSEEESSRFSSITGTTLSSRRYGRVRQKRRRRRPPISRASSFSSITDSTMSLNIMAVTLNMDTVNFLGISIVGQSNKAGDGGIYVGSIMKGGAVAQDGRIEPGDMILEVNGISFEEMSNDDAVRTLREQVQRPGPITLVVAKCWDPNPLGGYFTIPRQEPVHPIDPHAWVLHTNAMISSESLNNDSHRQINGASVTGASSGGESSSTLSPPSASGLTPGMSMGTLTSGQTSMPLGTSAAAYNMAALFAASQQQQQQQQLVMPESVFQPPSTNMLVPHGYSQQVTPSVVTASSSLPEIERYSDPIPLSLSTTIPTVVHAMLQPDSGLDIRDRVWLKLTVPNAFIGSELVDWLFRHLEGLTDRKEAKKYASSLLKLGYIRHIVNKMTFSEQCYYVFQDVSSRLSCLSLEEVDSVSEVGAMAHPNWGHNTTSTNLTLAPISNNVTHMPEYNSTVVVPHGVLGMGSGEGNSSQYSTVPSAYHPPTALAAPIRQLIADGQNAAANMSVQVKHLGNINEISGYSSSSSTSSSESNHFKSEVPSHGKSRPGEVSSSSFNHSPNLKKQQRQNQSQFLTNLSQSSTTPASVPHGSLSVFRSTHPPHSQQSFLSTAKQDNAALSTGSSSTSGERTGQSTTNKSDGKQHLFLDSFKRDSVLSSKSSSDSSCTPLNPNQSENQLPVYADPSHRKSSHLISNCTSNYLAPLPPPRISTATSGFSLTGRN